MHYVFKIRTQYVSKKWKILLTRGCTKTCIIFLRSKFHLSIPYLCDKWTFPAWYLYINSWTWLVFVCQVVPEPIQCQTRCVVWNGVFARVLRSALCCDCRWPVNWWFLRVTWSALRRGLRWLRRKLTISITNLQTCSEGEKKGSLAVPQSFVWYDPVVSLHKEPIVLLGISHDEDDKRILKRVWYRNPSYVGQ